MGAFVIVHDINVISTGSAKYGSSLGPISEKVDYPFSNAYLYPYQPELEWRSSYRPAIHVLSITPTGTYDTIVLLGTNVYYGAGGTFQKHLPNDCRAIVQYSSAQSGANGITLTSPTLDNTLPYFRCWGIIAGTRTELGKNPGLPSFKSLYSPQRISGLAGGATRRAVRGGSYHSEIRWKRNGLSYAEAASLRDFKKDVARTAPFILYENQETNKGIYLVRRLSDFAVTEDEEYFSDELVMREIA